MIMELFTSKQNNEAVGKFNDTEEREYILINNARSGTPSGDVLAAIDKVSTC
jgi:hypothetical protein